VRSLSWRLARKAIKADWKVMGRKAEARESQQASLRAAGAERVFSEKISGAVTDRKALAKALAAFEIGNVPLVTRLDRLTRSTRDLLHIPAQVGDRRAALPITR
jgi:DNA invertase Pin-like site-specific DNA recombinase